MRQSALWATTRAYLRSPSASRFTAPMSCEHCDFCSASCLLTILQVLISSCQMSMYGHTQERNKQHALYTQ